MPYELKKRGKGYVVVKKGGGKAFSKKPLPRARALAQLRALYANTDDLAREVVRSRRAR